MSSTQPGAPRTPTPRRVVAGYLLLALLGVAALVGLGELLRHETPAGGPVTPEVAGGPDPLRGEVECPDPPAREGTPRPASPLGPDVPQAVDSNQLYDCPDTWDGRRVRYEGEVVGAILARSDHAWIQLNDDVYAGTSGPLPTHRDFRGGNAGVGARVLPAHAAAIGVVGGPHTRGDVVEVVATFRRVDPASAEVAVLEVHELRVLRTGRSVDPPPAPARRVVASIAAAVALGVLAIERRRRRDR